MLFHLHHNRYPCTVLGNIAIRVCCFVFGPYATEELVHQVCMCLVYVCMVYRYMIVYDAHRRRADVLWVACIYMDCLHVYEGHLPQFSGFGSHVHTCIHDVVHLLLIAHGGAAAWAAQVMLLSRGNVCSTNTAGESPMLWRVLVLNCGRTCIPGIQGGIES